MAKSTCTSTSEKRHPFWRCPKHEYREVAKRIKFQRTTSTFHPAKWVCVLPCTQQHNLFCVPPLWSAFPTSAQRFVQISGSHCLRMTPDGVVLFFCCCFVVVVWQCRPYGVTSLLIRPLFTLSSRLVAFELIIAPLSGGGKAPN